MREIAEMLKFNKSLLELNLANQKYATGTNAEEAFASSFTKNRSLLKLKLKVQGAPSRTAIDIGLRKNNDLARSSR